MMSWIKKAPLQGLSKSNTRGGVIREMTVSALASATAPDKVKVVTGQMAAF